MIAAERGYLLLCSHLGCPGRRPLSPAQLRTLASRVRTCEKQDGDRALCPEDLLALGYRRPEAERICALFEDETLLQRYLQRAEDAGCHPLSRISPGYPGILRSRLGDDAPGCLWVRGNPELLEAPKIALVGSRALYPENAYFARQVGLEAARQGYVLVSGNARGADQTAQNAALEAGGRVLCVVADELSAQPQDDRILWLSEDGFDLPFSAPRALSRNRIIHALAGRTFVAQSSLRKGGSWDGAVRNLRAGWSPLFCLDDGRESTRMLEQMGAGLVTVDDLADLEALEASQEKWF